jgi:AraC-like DNA-binding protein
MPRPTEGTVRVAAAAAIPDVLRSLGADPAEVVAEAGLDLELFADPDNQLPYAALGRLLRLCVARTGCPHFALLVCRNGGLHSMGLVGLLMKYSPDVGSALRNLRLHLRLHVQGATTTLEVAGDTAMLGYAVYQPRMEAVDQITDGALAVQFNIMRELCGPDWKATEVLFAHRKPKDVGPFRRFFRAPLRFDAEQDALVFPAHWLERPVAGAYPELRRLLQRQVDALEASHRDDFPEQVRRVLRTALLTNHGGADNVASLFSIHSRTMHRRLAAYGIGFRDLVDEGRYGISTQMLEDPQIEVTQIAAALGYADASAFTRAFRRWSGATPTQWRATRAGAG